MLHGGVSMLTQNPRWCRGCAARGTHRAVLCCFRNKTLYGCSRNRDPGVA